MSSENNSRCLLSTHRMPGAASGTSCITDAFNSNKPPEIGAPAFGSQRRRDRGRGVKLSGSGLHRERWKQASGPGLASPVRGGWLGGLLRTEALLSAEQGTSSLLLQIFDCPRLKFSEIPQRLTALLLPPPLTSNGGQGSPGSSGRGFPYLLLPHFHIMWIK